MITGMRRLGRLVPAPGWMALALLAGFLAGLASGSGATGAVALARLAGGLWLDALKMTILPLIFALVTTSLAALATGGGAEAARIGRRVPLLMAGLLLAAALIAMLLAPPLLALHPLPPETMAGLRVGLSPAATAPSPDWIEMARGFVPVNVVASAAAGALVPLVVFAAVLGMALGRVEAARAEALLGPLRALADAMIVVVGWVLRMAPGGIFALAFVIGATAGLGALAALGHYVLVHAAVALAVLLVVYLLVMLFSPVPLARFARAVAPAQAVAAGTQSSIASLPAMLASAGRIGITESDAGVVLSFAVAVFKVTAGSGTIVTGLGMAWLAGVPVGPHQLIAAFPLAVLATFTVLGVPGAGSVIAATTPVAVALGAPLELLPIVLAVDVIPDMFRTTANVTADVALAAIAAPPSSAQPTDR